jgi:hypothetical protein
MWLRLVAFVVVVCLMGVSGCATSATPTADPSFPAAPLATSSVTSAGTWAVVPMGHLNDPLNTFWEIFFRPTDGTLWTLATPRGVADNGGVVMTTGAGSTAVVAFLPSQNLVFSPLAQSSDDGITWAPGLIPDALASDPDALAKSSDGRSWALVPSDGGQVLASASNLTNWRTLITRKTLAGTRAGLVCGLGPLTALTVGSSEGPLIGSTCSKKGTVGIFGVRRGRWDLVGPSLPRPLDVTSTTVLRLDTTQSGVSILIALDAGGRTSIEAAWRNDGAIRWTTSPPFVMDRSDRIMSTGIGENGAYVIMTADPRRLMSISAIAGLGGHWHTLTSPPFGTQTIVPGPNAEVDALAVRNSQLTTWMLPSASSTWERGSVLDVPIVYGTSD